ncbi:MAG: DNA topoisomerase IV subunit A [Candidatus Altarchaeaceae archaeon]
MKKDEEIELKIRNLGNEILDYLNNGESPYFSILARNLDNVEFDNDVKKIKIKDKILKRSFLNVAHTRRFTQTLYCASAIYEHLLKTGKTTSLRDLFYIMKRTIPNTKINLVDEQEESNSAVEDLELILNTLRENLHINAKKKGSIAGEVIIKDKDDIIYLDKLGSGGWAIPSNVEDIEFKKCDAEFVLFMEKDAVWNRLNEDKFWKKNKCIIVESGGQATRGVRRILQRLNKELSLPIYVLVDFDPWGIYIYSVLKYGSITLAHMSDLLSISDVKFLGLNGNDIKRYKLEKHLIRLNDLDIKRLKEIENYPWFKDKKHWKEQFEIMKNLNSKAEIEALSARGISFISEKYLPEKILNNDFLD